MSEEKTEPTSAPEVFFKSAGFTSVETTNMSYEDQTKNVIQTDNSKQKE